MEQNIAHASYSMSGQVHSVCDWCASLYPDAPRRVRLVPQYPRMTELKPVLLAFALQRASLVAENQIKSATLIPAEIA